MEPIQDDIETLRGQLVESNGEAVKALKMASELLDERDRLVAERDAWMQSQHDTAIENSLLVAERDRWEKAEKDAVQRHAEAESRYYAMKAERDRLMALWKRTQEIAIENHEDLEALEAERDRLIQALERIADSHKTFESAGADIRGQHCLDLQRIAREALTKTTEEQG